MNLFQPDMPEGLTWPEAAGYACVPLQEGGFRLSMPGGELDYFPQFMTRSAADTAMEALLAMEGGDWRAQDWSREQPQGQAWLAADWQHVPIRIFGREVMQPRFTAWHGDAGAAYTYSGRLHVPAPWSPALTDLRRQVETATGQDFNAVLLNWYRNGQDSMGWHSDDEAELGHEPVIASLSLGASRKFVLRQKSAHAVRVEAMLGHGALLVMRGQTQRNWQHALPRTRRVPTHRINLTFRKIFPQKDQNA